MFAGISRRAIWIAVCLAVSLAAPAWAAKVVEVRVGNHPTFTRVVFELDAAAGYRVERREDAGGKAELLVTLEAASTPRDVTRRTVMVERVAVQHGVEQSVVHIRLHKSPSRVKELILSDPPRVVFDLVFPESQLAAIRAREQARKQAAAEKAAAPKPAPVVAKPTPLPKPEAKPAPVKVAKPKPAPAVSKPTPEPPKPVAKVEPKPAPAPKPETKPAPVKVAKPTPAPVSPKPAPEPPKPVAKVEPKPEPRPLTKPEPRPLTKPEPVKVAKPKPGAIEPGPEAVAPKPLPESSRPLAKTRPKPEPRTKPSPTPKPEVEPATQAASSGGMDPLWLLAAGGLIVLLLVVVLVVRRRRALPNDLDVTALAEEEQGAGAIPEEGFAMGGAEPTADVGSADSELPRAETRGPDIGAGPGLFDEDEPEKETETMDTEARDLPMDRTASELPTQVAVGAGAGGGDVARLMGELERRVAQLETRLDEQVDARERLERQVAAQAEELRVQRAAIARTQRALRSLNRGEEEQATEPALREPK